MATTTTTNATRREVLSAAETGDADRVRRWIDSGGDPNLACRGPIDFEQGSGYLEDETLLMIAAMSGHVDVMQILLQAGADPNITRPTLRPNENEGDRENALSLALQDGQPEAAQLLLESGADRTTFQWMARYQKLRTLGAAPDHRILRMFLMRGVNILGVVIHGDTIEEIARSSLTEYTQRSLSPSEQSREEYAGFAKKYASLVEVIDGVQLAWRDDPEAKVDDAYVVGDVRIAGSYREFVLRDYKQLLRIRSLLARGRATMASSTPEVIARLFGGTAAASRRPPTRRSRPPPTRSAGVPDPVFWKVLEFYRLGDWRRPCTLPA